MRDIDELLKNNLTPDFAPADDLNASILQQAKENRTMKKKSIKTSMAAAIAIAVLAVGSVTGYAAYRLLSPADVTHGLSNMATDKTLSGNFDKLAKAFESEDAVLINESVTDGDYVVTLHGLVSGKELCTFEGMDGHAIDKIDEEKTYIVVSTENPSDTSKYGIAIDVLVNGQNSEIRPIRGGSETLFEQDGVKYYCVEFYDMEKYSGLGVYLGVTELGDGEIVMDKAFTMDEETGVYTANPDFDGLNVIFKLPELKGADNESALDNLESLKIQEEDAKVTYDVPEHVDIVDSETGLPIIDAPELNFAPMCNEKADLLRKVSMRDLTRQQSEALIACGKELASQKLSIDSESGCCSINLEYGGVVWEGGASLADENDTMLTYFSRDGEGNLVLKAIVSEDGAVYAKVFSYGPEEIDNLFAMLRS